MAAHFIGTRLSNSMYYVDRSRYPDLALAPFVQIEDCGGETGIVQRLHARTEVLGDFTPVRVGANGNEQFELSEPPQNRHRVLVQLRHKPGRPSSQSWAHPRPGDPDRCAQEHRKCLLQIRKNYFLNTGKGIQSFLMDNDICIIHQTRSKMTSSENRIHRG